VMVYLDNSVWCRNFDWSNDLKVAAQKKALNEILRLREKKGFTIACSDAVEAELMPLLEKGREDEKESIMDFIRRNSDYRLETAYNRLGSPKWARLGVMRLAKQEVIDKVNAFVERGIPHDDAVHLATASDNGVDYFVTVDEDLLKKTTRLQEDIKIVAPNQLMSILESKS